jgi:SRSO17 transposase
VDETSDVDGTGDRKRGHGIALAATQYIGKRGHTANGVVSVTSHWADGTRHVPLGVRPYRPARRLPLGKADSAFRTTPELAWELVEEARAAGIAFRVVVADCVYGENLKFESRPLRARIRYVLALRPNRGTWQSVQDPRHPPAFTPAEAAHRLLKDQWQRTARLDSLRDWIEHYYKPAQHELGWADCQVRPERAIVRHRHLVMLAFTFSLLAGTGPPASEAAA